MHTIKVLAGSGGIGTGDGYLMVSDFFLPIKGRLWPETVQKGQIADVSIATEESVKRIGGTVGWGLVGGALLGPVGLLAGLMLDGRGKTTFFTLTLRDGRSLLGSCDTSAFIAIKAATL